MIALDFKDCWQCPECPTKIWKNNTQLIDIHKKGHVK